jgi:hypothetical protein
MSERETIRRLAKQESARRSESAQQQGSREMSNEQTGHVEEQLKQIHERLDHIERNLILQQPNVIEFTKQVYPHIEAVIQKCETAEQKQLALEKMLDEHEAHMAENWKATDEIVERQKTEFTAISERLQGMAVRDLQGYHQEICNNMTALLAAEKKCEAALAECRSLVRQVGQTYETASATIEELAETATKHVNEVKDTSAKAIEQARAKFVKTFRRLDTTLWDHPLLGAVMMAILTVCLSAMTVWTLNRFTISRVINESVEASTTATQEALKPFLEKIERQTESLDVTYQQSEAFELYLRSLPTNQRDKRRAELIEGVKRQKQTAAEDARRQAE